MSFEAVSRIVRAEGMARTAVAEAERQARELVAEAERVGRLAVSAAEDKAEQELKRLSKRVTDKARSDAEELSNKTAGQCASLRAIAMIRAEYVSDLIVERIVRG